LRCNLPLVRDRKRDEIAQREQSFRFFSPGQKENKK
jgi:hypothetical protein